MALEAESVAAVRKAFAVALAVLTTSHTDTPGDEDILRDVKSALHAALLARGVPPGDIKPNWTPESEFTELIWGMTLTKFEKILQSRNPAYEPFDTQPAFAIATLSMELTDICVYLAEKVKEALS